jgi:hypothetical protein
MNHTKLWVPILVDQKWVDAAQRCHVLMIEKCIDEVPPLSIQLIAHLHIYIYYLTPPFHFSTFGNMYPQLPLVLECKDEFRYDGCHSLPTYRMDLSWLILYTIEIESSVVVLIFVSPGRSSNEHGYLLPLRSPIWSKQQPSLPFV